MKAALLVVVSAALSVGQTTGGAIDGSWSAKFEGRTFIRLQLKSVNGAIAGGMSIGNFEVDAQGVVRRADDAPRNLTPILGATLRGSSMTFSRKDENDIDRFELRLLDAGHAELRLLLNDDDREELAASGVPMPKPIPLTKGD